MIKFANQGNFSNTNKFFEKMLTVAKTDFLEKYGQEGVKALSAATPTDTGDTANSWGYEIKRTNKGATISWFNTNVENGVNVAIIIQYGHGTRNGGWVEGRDYINPAMRSIFDAIAESAWKEVTQS